MKECSNDISGFLKAFRFAAQKHQHQRRKDERAVPYINHLIAVAETLWEVGEIRDIDTIVAGILHDTLEDTDTSPDELADTFGARVCSIVEEVTDDKDLAKQLRKRLQIEHAGHATLEARQVKLADKICNVHDLIESPPASWSWERQREYVNWAEKVINGLRGSNKQLEQYFDEICHQVRQHLESVEGVEEGISK